MKISKTVWLVCLVGTVLNASGASLYKQKCKNCHGSHGEKKAMGKSKAIHKMSVSAIEKSMYDYASGKKKAMSYVVKVKKDFVHGHNDKTLHALAVYIHGL